MKEIIWLIISHESCGQPGSYCGNIWRSYQLQWKKYISVSYCSRLAKRPGSRIIWPAASASWPSGPNGQAMASWLAIWPVAIVSSAISLAIQWSMAEMAWPSNWCGQWKPSLMKMQPQKAWQRLLKAISIVAYQPAEKLASQLGNKISGIWHNKKKKRDSRQQWRRASIIGRQSAIGSISGISVACQPDWHDWSDNVM